jgi:hypothetical protein
VNESNTFYSSLIRYSIIILHVHWSYSTMYDNAYTKFSMKNTISYVGICSKYFTFEQMFACINCHKDNISKFDMDEMFLIKSHFYKGLDTLSINIGPVPSQKLMFRHFQIFWSELFVEYSLCIEMTFVLENARAYYKYRIQNWRIFLTFTEFHVSTLKSLKMNLATLFKEFYTCLFEPILKK